MFREKYERIRYEVTFPRNEISKSITYGRKCLMPI